MNIKINTTADLPDSWHVLVEAYRKTGDNNDSYISPAMKKKIIVLATESVVESEKKLIIIVSFDDKSKLTKNLRALMVRFKGLYNKIVVADCYNLRVIEDILFEEDKRGKNNNLEMNSEDKERLDEVRRILDTAMNYGSSDIHVEVQNGKCLVKFRINTEIILYRPELPEFGVNFSRICYTIFPTLGDEDGSAPGTYNQNEILEGSFTISTENQKVKARMLNLPHNHGGGFDFILRLIDKKKRVEAKPLNKLNFSIQVTRGVQSATRSNSGMILICGITGSGKSTTLQNLILNEVKNAGGKRKIITIEQPVEYPLPGVTQISGQDPKSDTPDSQNFSFDNLNRYFLRADPDSLGYGEIRDSSSAFAAYKGVESGHKVYATTHTSSAISCYPRMKSFGLTMEQITKPGFIAGILYQQLLPKLCPECSIPYDKYAGVPKSFDENFVLNAHLSVSETIDFNILKMANENVGKDESVIRYLQNNGLLRATDAVDLLFEMDSLNDKKEDILFKNRLDKLVDNNFTLNNKSTIRFRGKGCKKCFNGTVGVVPVAECIVPDNNFLALIRKESITEAENYWRTMLGGKTSIEDAYSKIFDGTVDPRSAEMKLSKQLNSH